MTSSDLFIDSIAERVVEKLRCVGALGQSARRWPEVMDVETAAEYLDRTPEAVRGLIRKKLVPLTRIGARVQIRRLDLDRLIEKNTI